jgi:ATP-dependent exoDNAse (exonuclease V) beta subunit
MRLGATSSFGLKRDDLIVKDGDMFAVDERLAGYERWRDARTRVLAEAARPTVKFQTATAWAAEAASSGLDQALLERPVADDITVLQLPGAADRPRGAGFGTLVHAVLATVTLDAADDVVARTAHTQARIINASAAEAAAAATVASAVLRHDLLARARASAVVMRETPVSWLNDDGTLIEGVLDLAFHEGETTVVVDFKTDHELSAGESRYRAQLRQYVHAVARATGRRATGILFRI